jgi:hypothetical protein
MKLDSKLSWRHYWEKGGMSCMLLLQELVERVEGKIRMTMPRAEMEMLVEAIMVLLVEMRGSNTRIIMAAIGTMHEMDSTMLLETMTTQARRMMLVKRHCDGP